MPIRFMFNVWLTWNHAKLLNNVIEVRVVEVHVLWIYARLRGPLLEGGGAGGSKQRNM